MQRPVQRGRCPGRKVVACWDSGCKGSGARRQGSLVCQAMARLSPLGARAGVTATLAMLVRPANPKSLTKTFAMLQLQRPSLPLQSGRRTSLITAPCRHAQDARTLCSYAARRWLLLHRSCRRKVHGAGRQVGTSGPGLQEEHTSPWSTALPARGHRRADSISSAQL